MVRVIIVRVIAIIAAAAVYIWRPGISYIVSSYYRVILNYRAVIVNIYIYCITAVNIIGFIMNVCIVVAVTISVVGIGMISVVMNVTRIIIPGIA